MTMAHATSLQGFGTFIFVLQIWAFFKKGKENLVGGGDSEDSGNPSLFLFLAAILEDMSVNFCSSSFLSSCYALHLLCDLLLCLQIFWGEVHCRLRFHRPYAVPPNYLNNCSTFRRFSPLVTSDEGKSVYLMPLLQFPRKP
jgi:hypothetical protein